MVASVSLRKGSNMCQEGCAVDRRCPPWQVLLSGLSLDFRRLRKLFPIACQRRLCLEIGSKGAGLCNGVVLCRTRTVGSRGGCKRCAVFTTTDVLARAIVGTLSSVSRIQCNADSGWVRSGLSGRGVGRRRLRSLAQSDPNDSRRGAFLVGIARVLFCNTWMHEGLMNEHPRLIY